MRVHYLQHVPFEDPGAVTFWAKDGKHEISATHLYADETPPRPDAYDMLIVLGGPMSVHDEETHPWLAVEKAALKDALDAGGPVLGICLGAQLLAHVLGADISKSPEPERGWFDVALADEAKSLPLLKDIPETFPAYHWHGETFDIPDGAVRLGGSPACANQGFIWKDRVAALQFHLETMPANMMKLLKHRRGEMDGGREYVQTTRQMHDGRANFKKIKEINSTLLDNLAAAGG